MDKQRALHFIAAGLPPARVATIVGVSPGRISQLLKEEGIAEELEAARIDNQAKQDQDVLLEAKQTSIKHSLLDQLANTIHEASFMEIARAYDIITRADAATKRNNIPLPGTQIFNGTLLQISLPGRIFEQEIHVTKEKEVTAIGDRVLAPLQSAQVTSLFSRMKGDQNEQASLPGSAETGHREALQTSL